VAEEAALAAGHGETGVLGGHGQVARGHQLAPRGGGQRVDLGHHGLGDRLDGVHHLGAHLEQPPGRDEVGAGHVGEVVAGREHRPVGGQDHAEGVAGPHLAEGRRQLQHHVEREGVALLGPVEGDGGDVTLLLDQEMLVRHGLSLSAAPPSVNVEGGGGP
jgi:hypothetical protein